MDRCQRLQAHPRSQAKDAAFPSLKRRPFSFKDATFLVKEVIFPVKDETACCQRCYLSFQFKKCDLFLFPCQRCNLSLSKMPPFYVKGTIFPWPRWSLSHQRCLLSVSEMGWPPVKDGTSPCPNDLSLSKMLSFSYKDGALPCQRCQISFPSKDAFFPFQKLGLSLSNMSLSLPFPALPS